MKTYTRITALVLALCLMASCFSGCGKGSPTETAAPTEAPAASPTVAVTDAPTVPETTAKDLNSPFYIGLSALQKVYGQCQGFNFSYTGEGIGTVDGTSLNFTVVHTRYQHEENDDLSASYGSRVKTSDRYISYNFSTYYTDGVYYSEDSNNSKLHICSQPSISPAAAPGSKLLDLMTRCEMKEVFDTDLSCSFTMKGTDMKDVVADLLPTVYSEIDSGADWSDISGDFTVDFYADSAGKLAFFEKIQISSPSLGALLLRSAKPGCTADCNEFLIKMNVNYSGTFVLTPYKIETAVPGKPLLLVGMNHALKEALGLAAAPQIPAETEPEETFTPVIITDHESTLPDYFPNTPDQPTQTPATEPSVAEAAPQIPELDENTIALTVNNKTVLFSLPTEIKHYDTLKQDVPERATMAHDIFTDISGRTIVELYCGTPEDYIGGYLSKNMSETKIVTIDGHEVLLWQQNNVNDLANGKKIYNDFYYFAIALDNNTSLCFRVDSTYRDSSKCEIKDSIVQILLSHCTIL